MPKALETIIHPSDEGYGRPFHTGEDYAPGRLPQLKPVAIIDIGSNSVRLVVYEGITRAPTPLFNEKELCGLGKSVASTGRLDNDAMQEAYATLRRFRALANQMQASAVHVLATAAVREAQNANEFLNMASSICDCPVEVISGNREARLSALGVISGLYKPDGIVGDLGGGSLELVDVKGQEIGQGVTLPLGGLRLVDEAGKTPKKAEKLVEKALKDIDLSHGKNRAFYGVGGTWRAIARLHMKLKNYPLHVTHAYEIDTAETIEFCRFLQKNDEEAEAALAQVPTERRQLVSYGALVLEHVLKCAKPSRVIMSALGVREGLLFSQLGPQEREEDPLISAARDLSLLRSRSPQHGEELCAWTDGLFSSLKETEEEKRLRQAACLLADISWRAHPDYRGEQSLNIIAHGAFIGIDHPGRIFLALAIYHRHKGASEKDLPPRLLELASERLRRQAAVLGLAMRVAYLISATMPGILPQAPISIDKDRLLLQLLPQLADLRSKKLDNRFNKLAKVLGLSPTVVITNISACA